MENWNKYYWWEIVETVLSKIIKVEDTISDVCCTDWPKEESAFLNSVAFFSIVKYAHFQLKFVIVSRLKNHVICYKSSPHWLEVTETANQFASKKDLKQSRR